MRSNRVATVPAAGAAKLSLRFAIILNEHNVTEQTQAMLGDSGYDTIQMFAAGVIAYAIAKGVR